MAARESGDVPRRIADLDGQDAYVLLGVRPDASQDEISAAYRREMARAHPDRGGSAGRAQLVNCAFDVLTRYRDHYDDLLDAFAQAAGPDVQCVEPDAERLGDPLPVGPRRWWIRRGPLLGVAAAFVAAAVLLFPPGRFSRGGGSGQPPPGDAWTTSQVRLTHDAPVVGSGTAFAPSTSPAPTAPPGSSWSVPASLVVVAASAPPSGGGHRCEVRGDGSLWCAGGNARGQLGNGTTRDAEQPVRVAGPPGVRWTAVAVGGRATCGLHEGGGLWCWGDNAFGQLGDGTDSFRAAPVAVDPGSRWLTVAVDTHVCAVRGDHTLWCWGTGRLGELAGDVRADQASPLRVGPEAAWAAVSVGPGWTCGLRQDGSRRCWGSGTESTAGR